MTKAKTLSALLHTHTYRHMHTHAYASTQTTTLATSTTHAFFLFAKQQVVSATTKRRLLIKSLAQLKQGKEGIQVCRG